MPDPATSGLVCVATSLDVPQAQLWRGRLDSVGISVILFDEHISQTAWHYLFALGGVRLMVPNPCAEEARALLHCYQSMANDYEESCESCDCTNVERLHTWTNIFGIFAAIAAICVGVSYAFHRRRRKCRICGQTWRV